MSTDEQKPIDDSIDWKIIDQLHNSTLNFSQTSIEIKKLLFVLIGIALPVLFELAGKKIDISLFVTIYAFVVTFWFLDSFTYYYQEKLRQKMDEHFSKIINRNQSGYSIVNHDGFTIKKSRGPKNRVIRSIFNYSSIMYPVLFILNTIGFLLHLIGIIK